MEEDIRVIKELIESASDILIIQADNPDSDSLGSALALEQILHDKGKVTHLFCGVNIPNYLHYLSGWSRVEREFPEHFDLSIVVDASTMTLLEHLNTVELNQLSKRPSITFDHHKIVENPLPFSTVIINDHERASTGELIYLLADSLGFGLSGEAKECIMASILGDTQGLSNQLTSTTTYRVVADIIDSGVDRLSLEERRRQFAKMPLEVFKYKADLISRAEVQDGIAMVFVPQEEINKYSASYNPGPLIQPDMLLVDEVKVAIVIKTYDDGHVTGAIRSNYGYPIAAKLAEKLGGGGHDYASGFKMNNNPGVAAIKAQCIAEASSLIAALYTNIFRLSMDAH